ncbi:kielin/chordin-like protein [Branchiostoma floridae]|uniref:Kielin/chordin-like protein n=1 Tax=Branchiostoma floridae TaxID=7739 RepID=A0A9J7L9U4_BRAFL|nr:kielin/chordin-like protein [Branchiostoma floridae]XP_035678218.1 kielin/chordin-like protein [Branchiostoma floridae]
MLWKLLLLNLVMFVAFRGTTSQYLPVPQPEPQPPGPSSGCAADIVFIVDDSSSILGPRFGLALQFIIDFLQCFTDQDIGIGVILYNCVPRTGIPLGMYTISNPGLPFAISNLTQEGGLSRTGHALSFMTDTSKFRTGIPRTAILLSDGFPQSDANAQAMDDYEAQAEAARDAGIDLYAVGVGAAGSVNWDVLETITGSSDRVFRSDNPCRVAFRILADLCASAAEVGCLYNGLIIRVGEEYKPDDCTWCTCPAAGEEPVCYIQDCAAPYCDDPVKVAGQCCRSCDPPPGCLHNGAIIPVGEQYRAPDGCSWCHCEADGAQAICAAVGCAFSSACVNHVRYAGECCPVCPACCLGCQHGDGIVPLGASFQEDPCTTCHCYGGHMACAVVACAAPPCANPVHVPGQCCPVCIGCDHQDGIILVDKDYKVNDCMTCSCPAAGQQPICSTASCMAPACDPSEYTKVAGQCCPVCQAEAPEGCPYNGIVIPLHTIYKPDDCTECNCYEAGVAPACIAILCPAPACPNPVDVAGQCCPVCREIVATGDYGTM